MATKKVTKKGNAKKPSKLKAREPTLKEVERDREFELPKKKNKPSSSLSDYVIMVHGTMGIGKTSLGAAFPDSLTLQFEPGGKALTSYQVPIADWIDFRKAVKALSSKGGGAYSNIVIDTGHIAYMYCKAYVCKKLEVDDPGDVGYGKGWDAVRTEFTQRMNELFSLSKGAIVVCHSVDKEIETASGRKYHKCSPVLSGQAESYFSGPVDVVGYYNCDKDNERWLQLVLTEHIEAKNRLEERFIAKDGQPVFKVPMGNSADEAYENLLKAFNNEQELSYRPDNLHRKSKLKKTAKTKTKTKTKTKNKRNK